MKRTIVIMLFFLFVGLSLFIGSCVKPVPDLAQEDFIKLDMQKDVGLTVGKTDKGNIFVLLDGFDNNYIVLQTQFTTAFEGNKSYRAAVKRSENYIFIKTDAGENIILQTPGAEIPQELQNLKYKFKGLGFGFIQMANSELYGRAKGELERRAELRSEGGTYIISDPIAEVSCKCRMAKIEPDDDCKSGGHGSNSCSKGTGKDACSVSCDKGYFSCCRD